MYKLDAPEQETKMVSFLRLEAIAENSPLRDAAATAPSMPIQPGAVVLTVNGRAFPTLQDFVDLVAEDRDVKVRTQCPAACAPVCVWSFLPHCFFFFCFAFFLSFFCCAMLKLEIIRDFEGIAVDESFHTRTLSRLLKAHTSSLLRRSSSSNISDASGMSMSSSGPDTSGDEAELSARPHMSRAVGHTDARRDSDAAETDEPVAAPLDPGSDAVEADASSLLLLSSSSHQSGNEGLEEKAEEPRAEQTPQDQSDHNKETADERDSAAHDRLSAILREQEATARREQNREGPALGQVHIKAVGDPDAEVVEKLADADSVHERSPQGQNDGKEVAVDEQDSPTHNRLMAILREQEAVARREQNREGPALGEVRIKAVGDPDAETVEKLVDADSVHERPPQGHSDGKKETVDKQDSPTHNRLMAILREQEAVARREQHREGPAVGEVRIKAVGDPDPKVTGKAVDSDSIHESDFDDEDGDEEIVQLPTTQGQTAADDDAATVPSIHESDFDDEDDNEGSQVAAAHEEAAADTKGGAAATDDDDDEAMSLSINESDFDDEVEDEDEELEYSATANEDATPNTQVAAAGDADTSPSAYEHTSEQVHEDEITTVVDADDAPAKDEAADSASHPGSTVREAAAVPKQTSSRAHAVEPNTAQVNIQPVREKRCVKLFASLFRARLARAF